MQAEYTRAEFMQIVKLLASNMDKYTGKIAYAANKNLRRAKEELEDIEAERKPTQEYIAYNKARIELCKKLAKRKNGEPVIENDQFVFKDDKQADIELAVLAKTNEAVIKAQQAQLEAFDKALEDKVTIEWYELAYDEKAIENLNGSALYPIMEFFAAAPVLEKK